MATDDLIAEARHWLDDTFGAAGSTLADAKVKAVVDATYHGGWDGFVADSRANHGGGER